MSSQGFPAGSQWECPVCRLVPPKEIFSCQKGHSFCTDCEMQLPICPTCRVSFGDQKIRNYGLEELLDSIKLDCRWLSCNSKFSRTEISEHEDKCHHNPNAIKICCLFENTIRGLLSFAKDCTFHFLLESLQEAANVDKVIEHMRSTHRIQEKRIKLGEPFDVNFSLNAVKYPNPNSALKYRTFDHFVQSILTMEYENRKHMFLHLARFDSHQMMSLMLIQLTPNLGSLANSHFTLNMFIKSQPREDNGLSLDPACTVTISWKTRPVKIETFFNYCGKDVDEQLSFPAPIPILHLEQHYADVKSGMITSGFTITRN